MFRRVEYFERFFHEPNGFFSLVDAQKRSCDVDVQLASQGVVCSDDSLRVVEALLVECERLLVEACFEVVGAV